MHARCARCNDIEDEGGEARLAQSPVKHEGRERDRKYWQLIWCLYLFTHNALQSHVVQVLSCVLLLVCWSDASYCRVSNI